MKLRSLLVTLAFALCVAASPVKAQVPDATLKTLNDGFAHMPDLSKQLTAENTTVIQLNNEKKALDDKTAVLAAAVTAFKADIASYNTRTEAHDKAQTEHNAKKPNAHCKECMDDYDLEAVDLNTQSKALQKEYDANLIKEQTLNKRVDNIISDENKYDDDYKKAVAAHVVLIRQANDFIKSLQPAAIIYGACMDKHPTDDDAALRHDCGNLLIDSIRNNVAVIIAFKPYPIPPPEGADEDDSHSKGF